MARTRKAAPAPVAAAPAWEGRLGGPLTPGAAGLLAAWARRGARPEALRRGHGVLLSLEEGGIPVGRVTLREDRMVFPDPRPQGRGQLALNRGGILGRI